MDQPTLDQYQELIQNIIAKQSVILGPDISVLKARNVKGLEIDATGRVIAITGDPNVIVSALIDQYVNLSGLIVKNAMEPLLKKFPGLNLGNHSSPTG
ncbi:MAG: hypothetical protein HY459_04675 [Parcubacteria group bacterium]|nr:hypothetical protein [Parcubacteria group bacterium]